MRVFFMAKCLRQSRSRICNLIELVSQGTLDLFLTFLILIGACLSRTLKKSDLHIPHFLSTLKSSSHRSHLWSSRSFMKFIVLKCLKFRISIFLLRIWLRWILVLRIVKIKYGSLMAIGTTLDVTNFSGVGVIQTSNKEVVSLLFVSIDII